MPSLHGCGGLGRKIPNNETVVGKGKRRSRMRSFVGEKKNVKYKVHHQCERLPSLLNSAIYFSKYLNSHNMLNAEQYFI